MIEINLIPDVKQELLRAQRQRAIVISGAITASVIALAAVVLLVLYVFGAQGVRGAIVDKGIEDQSKALSQVEDLSEMLTIQAQLSRLNELADSRAINSRLFDMLLAVVPPEPNSVQISNVDLNAVDKVIALEGQTPRYESIEVFKKTLERTLIAYEEEGEESTSTLASGISIGEVSYGEDATGQKVVRFKITFTHSDELLSSKHKTVGFKFSENGNVTDSYLGIPRSIFTDRAKDVE